MPQYVYEQTTFLSVPFHYKYPPNHTQIHPTTRVYFFLLFRVAQSDTQYIFLYFYAYDF